MAVWIMRAQMYKFSCTLGGEQRGGTGGCDDRTLNKMMFLLVSIGIITYDIVCIFHRKHLFICRVFVLLFLMPLVNREAV